VASISVLDGSPWSSGGKADWASNFGTFLESDQNNDKFKNLLKFTPNSIDGYVYKLVLSVATASVCKQSNGGVYRIFSDIFGYIDGLFQVTTADGRSDVTVRLDLTDGSGGDTGYPDNLSDNPGTNC